MDLGLLIARLIVGALLAVHGSQKLFGWFRGAGVSGTAAFFESLRFFPGRPFVVAAALAECGGGLLLTLGLVHPAAAASIVPVMIVAIATVHWGHGLLAPDGIELPLLYLTAALSLALTGPGAYSLDTVLGLDHLWTTRLTALLLAVGVAGGFLSLAVRRARAAIAHA